MNLEKRVEERAKTQALKLNYECKYIPSSFEEEDLYLVSNKKMNVYSYGKTKKEAYDRAIIQATVYLIGESHKNK